MRKHFPGYFRPSVAEFDALWRDATFAFDANFLLNVYRYTRTTQQRMLAILTKLGAQAWIPHQAALEFHRNRHRVIASQVAAYDQATKAITEALRTLENQLSRFSRHPVMDCKRLTDAFSRVCTELVEQIESDRKTHPNLDEHDELRDKLAEILDDSKVGAPFEVKDHPTHRSEGERRYKQKVPPGFKDDDDEKEHPYGDYFVWRQLIERAKSTQRPIIFTTDDRKEDWWLKVSGKTIGPRPELIQEMIGETGQMFYMYTSDLFLELAGKRLGVEISEDAVREVRDIREEGEAREGDALTQTAAGVDPDLVLGIPGRTIEVIRSRASDSDLRRASLTTLLHSMEQVFGRAAPRPATEPPGVPAHEDDKENGDEK